MAKIAISAIGFGFKHPNYTPAKDYAGAANVAAGIEFRMDDTVSGIIRMVVGEYMVSPTILEDVSGQAAADKRAFNALKDGVADVEVSWMTDLPGATDTPDDFFDTVKANPNVAMTVYWHYAAGDIDEADFIPGDRSKTPDNAEMLMGKVTLKYAGRKVETRA